MRLSSIGAAYFTFLGKMSLRWSFWVWLKRMFYYDCAPMELFRLLFFAFRRLFPSNALSKSNGWERPTDFKRKMVETIVKYMLYALPHGRNRGLCLRPAEPLAQSEWLGLRFSRSAMGSFFCGACFYVNFLLLHWLIMNFWQVILYFCKKFLYFFTSFFSL